MSFSSAAKELISVLSRYKSSEESVRWLPRGICELVREPTRDCERRNKILCQPVQASIELGNLGLCASGALGALGGAASCSMNVLFCLKML